VVDRNSGVHHGLPERGVTSAGADRSRYPSAEQEHAMAIENIEEQDPTTSDETGPASIAFAPTPQAAKDRTATWLFTLGFLIGAGALGLALVPQLLPQHGWILKACAKYGITSAPLLLTGLVFCGLAMAARGQARAIAQADPAAKLGMLLEQVASDVAQMRGGMQGLRVELVYLKDAATAQRQVERDIGTGEVVEGQRDALYRLAASLDQVSARIEQRMAAQHTELQSAISELKSNAEATSARIGDLAGTSANGHAADDAYEIRAAQRTRAKAAQPMQNAADGELDVWVELETEGDTSPDCSTRSTTSAGLSRPRPRRACALRTPPSSISRRRSRTSPRRALRCRASST
jgi:hypothetical protein